MMLRKNFRHLLQRQRVLESIILNGGSGVASVAWRRLVCFVHELMITRRASTSRRVIPTTIIEQACSGNSEPAFTRSNYLI